MARISSRRRSGRIACVELDLACVEETAGPRIEKLELLLAGRYGEASRENALCGPGETNRYSFRRSLVAVDDGQAVSLSASAKHDRIEPEDGALCSGALLTFGEVPGALPRIVVGFADGHGAVTVAVACSQRLEQKIRVHVVPELLILACRLAERGCGQHHHGLGHVLEAGRSSFVRRQRLREEVRDARLAAPRVAGGEDDRHPPGWQPFGAVDQLVDGNPGLAEQIEPGVAGNQLPFQLSRRALRERPMGREVEQHGVARAADTHFQFRESLQNCGAPGLVRSDELAHVIELAESRSEIPGVRRRKPQVIEAWVLEVIDAYDEGVSPRGLLRDPLRGECGDRLTLQSRARSASREHQDRGEWEPGVHQRASTSRGSKSTPQPGNTRSSSSRVTSGPLTSSRLRSIGSVWLTAARVTPSSRAAPVKLR